MKKIITLLVFCFCLNAKAQNYVAIPDSNFVHYLKTIVSNAFKGDSLDTTNVLVTTATHSITCTGRGIADLTGVTYFKSLKYLDCSNNNVSLNFNLPALPDSLIYLNCNLVVTLQSLPPLPTTLKYLYCYFTGLSSVPALPDSLVYLDCSYNNIFNSLPNLPNTLQTLICYSNFLDTLPYLPNTLVYLDCHDMGMSKLPTLPPSLRYLDCSSVLFLAPSYLPALPDSLQYLDCEGDSIFCFPTFPSSLTYVNLDYNPYDCLPNYVLPAMSSYAVTSLCGPGNTNGCPDVLTGIQQLKTENVSINYYPNPANTELTLEASQTDNYEISLLDVSGKLMLKQNMSTRTKIDLRNIDAGVYVLAIKSNEGIINKKIIVSR